MSARQPRRGTRDHTTHERDEQVEQAEREELLAIEEEILAALHAGEKPPLATYLIRFPALAQEILAFAIEHLDLAEAAGTTRAADQRTPLLPGMLAALERISARNGDREVPAESLSPRRVAEEGTAYTSAVPDPGAHPDTSEPGTDRGTNSE